MARVITAVVGAALCVFGGTLGLAADNVPTTTVSPASQMSDQQIRDQLAINGYTVEEMKRRGNQVSVIATDQQGATSRLLVDGETGQVKPAANDDDDDDGD